MSQDVTIPDLGEGILEATFATWLKSEGDSVVVGEDIAEIMTDKVNIAIESPSDGILTGLLCNPEEVVVVGQKIATVLLTEEQ